MTKWQIRITATGETLDVGEGQREVLELQTEGGRQRLAAVDMGPPWLQGHARLLHV